MPSSRAKPSGTWYFVWLAVIASLAVMLYGTYFAFTTPDRFVGVAAALVVGWFARVRWKHVNDDYHFLRYAEYARATREDGR